MTQLHHVTLHVDDLAAARRFYVEELGLTDLKKDVDYPGAFLALNDHQQLHLYQFPEPAPPSRRAHLCLRVADFSRVFHRMSELGILDVSAWGYARELPGGVLQTYVRDPADNLVEICSLPRERDQIDPTVFLSPAWGGLPYLHRPEADPAALARRSRLGFAEMIHQITHFGDFPKRAVRTSNLVGARMLPGMEPTPYRAAVVVTNGNPPADPTDLPPFLWTDGPAPDYGAHLPGFDQPLLGIWTATDSEAIAPADFHDPAVSTTTPAEVARLNDLAYGVDCKYPTAWLTHHDPRISAFALRDETSSALSVAVLLLLGDNAVIQYVATDPVHQRQGYAGRITRHVTAAARRAGARSVTLQSTPDAISLYRKLGFQRVGLLRCYDLRS